MPDSKLTRGRRRLATLAIAVLTVGLAPTVATTVLAPTPANAAGPFGGGIRVAGNRIVDADGHRVQLAGVNRYGGESMCVQGKGIWDGPVDADAMGAIASWNANSIRIPLNEDCWLGLNGVPAAYAKTHYIDAVKQLVADANSAGLAVELALSWSDGYYARPYLRKGIDTGSCFDTTAKCHKPMPDQANSLPFWTSVADTFKGNRTVVFDLFDAPYVPDVTGDAVWNCWLEGADACPQFPYDVAGTREMLNAVRATGATNVVVVEPPAYVLDGTGRLPSDPTGNLVVSDGDRDGCPVPLAAPDLACPVPVIAPDLTATAGIMTLPTRASYSISSWNVANSYDSPLIRDYAGTPTLYGQSVKAALLSRPRVDVQAPTDPAGLAVGEVTATTVALSWVASKDDVGVVGYDVMASGVKVAGTVGATSVLVTGLTAGTTYAFSVVARDAEGNVSAPSDALAVQTGDGHDAAVPSKPGNLHAVSVGATAVRLSWAASTDNVGVVGYDVYKWSSIEDRTRTSLTITLTGLTRDRSYTLRVRARDAAGNRSEPSTIVVHTAAVVDRTPPSAPTDLKVLSRSATSVRLGWAAAADNVAVTGYDVIANGTRVTGTAASLTATVTGLIADTSYSFTVKAKDADNNIGPASSSLSVRTAST